METKSKLLQAYKRTRFEDDFEIISDYGEEGSYAIKAGVLKAGDKIAFTAPASWLSASQHTNILAFQKYLESRGFVVIIGDSFNRKEKYLAGTDQQRADELMGFFKDEAVRAIWCMRGGWGCSRMIPLLDYDIIR